MGESDEAHSVLRVEDVGRWRVVQYDDVTQLSAQPTQVFHVVSSVEHAGFPKEPRPKHSPLVQQVSHGVSVLRHRKSKGQRFIGLAEEQDISATLKARFSSVRAERIELVRLLVSRKNHKVTCKSPSL